MRSQTFIVGMLRWMLLMCLGALPLFAADRAYWVWQRAEPLTEAEAGELRQQGVTTLYWHVATVGPDFTALAHVPDLSKMAPGFHVVPAVRVETGVLPPREVFLKLRRFAREGALHLDFDSPDRQIAPYAALLSELHAEVPHLGITALAHWASLKDFPALARSVEELCPMFYDLQSEPTGVSADAPPPPLLDPAQVEGLLLSWARCPTRWRAGLPVFSRLTIFDETGLSRGQIPSWEWDEVAFNKHLHTLAPTRLGVTLLRADAGTLVARRPLHIGDLLSVRITDRSALASCAIAAEKAGAAGTVLFRLPALESAATWSLRGFSGATDSSPRLTLRREGDTLLLQNEGGADLPPRLAGDRGDRDRGYALEVDAPAPVFREAEPGGFFRVGAHVDVEHTPRPTSVPTAERLTFWFSQLPAGASLHSGIFQLAPAADATKLRWRLAGGDWQPLTSP